MTIDLKTYNALLEKRDYLTNKISKARGSIETLKAQLQEEHGCSSVKEAKRKLQSLQSDLEKSEATLKAELANFEKEWGDKLL